ncbi:MAG: hypothetical protein GXO78_07075 [Calditrichaeota bacterium]|nr:hypothetical protein [Calditrichota bacterium]
MKRRMVLLALGTMLVAFLASCTSSVDKTRPPQIRYGEDPCDECYMLINEERFAAAYITQDGRVRRFDDIGCMLTFLKKHPEAVATFWVVDYQTHMWVDATKAYFVKAKELKSPMGYGLIAVGNEAVAKEIAGKHNGTVFSFKGLQEQDDLLSN